MMPIDVVNKLLAAENRRDWDTWISFYHPDATYTVIGSSNVLKGRREIAEKMRKIYQELPDWQFAIVHIISDNHTVMVEFDGHGHFTGMHNGQTYKDIPLTLEAVCVFEFKDGLIYREREYWDAEGFREQLSHEIG